MDQITEAILFQKHLETQQPPQLPPETKGRKRLWRDLTNTGEIPKHSTTRKLAMIGALTIASMLGHFVSFPIQEASSVVRVTAKEDTSKNKMVIKDSAKTQFDAEEKIAKELVNYQYDEVRIKNTLRWEQMIDLIVQDDRLKIAEADRQFWKNRILQIIFVESEGDPSADPADKIKDPQERDRARLSSAKGLMQIIPTTAREVAEQYQIYSYDLTNGWDNIFLGLGYQLNMAKKYGTEVAAWTHHLGPLNMNTALATYLIQVKKLPVDRVEKDIFETPDNDEIILKYIKDYQVSPHTLLTAPAVTAKLKEIEAHNNDTEFYWYRLIAAGRALYRLNIG